MDEKNVNKEWANKVSKADFIKTLDHHKDDADLGELWESLQEPKKEKAEPTESAKSKSNSDGLERGFQPK